MPEDVPEANTHANQGTSYKERPLLFMLILSLMIAANLLTGVIALIGLALTPVIAAKYASMMWVFYLAIILAFLNAAFGVFLFRWKRWAFYGLCISAVIGFALNLMIGSDIASLLSGLLGPAILYLTIRSKWRLLE